MWKSRIAGSRSVNRRQSISPFGQDDSEVESEVESDSDDDDSEDDDDDEAEEEMPETPEDKRLTEAIKEQLKSRRAIEQEILEEDDTEGEWQNPKRSVKRVVAKSIHGTSLVNAYRNPFVLDEIERSQGTGKIFLPSSSSSSFIATSLPSLSSFARLDDLYR